MKIIRQCRLALPLLVALVPLAACGSGSSSTGPGGERNAPSSISVMADASLKGAFTKIGQEFESQNAGDTVTFTYGSSAALAQKAVAKAPGDVLATTDQSAMDSAQKVQLNEPKIFATKGSAQCQIVTLLQSANGSLSQEFINLVASPTGQQMLHQAGFGPP